MKLENSKIAIIGLGYVGLPLAVAFAEKYPVVGFDINKNRTNELVNGIDNTQEIEESHLKSVLSEISPSVKGFFPTNNQDYLKDCTIFIVTVPTPTDEHNRPDLTPMIKASEIVAMYLKPDDLVIYESTVYPGVTEEEMAPILEANSGYLYNKDFYCGYSPERINPGDKEHTVTKILKVTSGSTPEVAEFVDSLYQSVISAGTYKAPSIKVAEAAKVIENSQRDINIAFVNELSKIFNLLGIDTNEVLEAASTKWNFIKFKPGLVGGHCIGVDPYYLAQKAQEVGYHPEIILAGRRLNDGMGKYIALEVVKLMIKNSLIVNKSDVLILGFTFKENCPDTRNTKVIDIINEFKSFGINLTILDPWANKMEVKKDYNLEIVNRLTFEKKFDAIVLGVAHSEFLNFDFVKYSHNLSVIYDVKGILEKLNISGRL